jgi:hypothetical protein
MTLLFSLMYVHDFTEGNAMGTKQMAGSLASEVNKSKITKAIVNANYQRFWKDCGIATERLSVCLSASLPWPTQDSIGLMHEAGDAYVKWGATAKVEQLNAALALVRDQENEYYINWIRTFHYPPCRLSL